MQYPLHVRRAALSNAIHHMTPRRLESFGALKPITSHGLASAIEYAAPGKPGAVHFIREGDDHRSTELTCSVCPSVDICVMFACNDAGQRVLIGTQSFLVRPIPRRAQHERNAAVTRDKPNVRHGKALFTPVARRSNDSLMFSNESLEVLNLLESHVVFGVAKVDVGAGKNSVCPA